MASRRLQKDIEIPALDGKLAIVTGANSGVGLGITERLAAAGAEVIMAIRNADKATQAIKDIRVKNPNASLQIELIDLSSLQSVRNFAVRLLGKNRPVNYLFNNAGLMTSQERYTSEDGFELHFATNYLAHFALTTWLMPLLIAGKSRVVSTGSSTVHSVKINLNDLQSEKQYSAANAYAQSKLASLMFAVELNNRNLLHGWNITSNAAQPGATRTNIQSSGSIIEKSKSRRPLFTRLGMKIPGIWQNYDKGCLPALFAATNSRATGAGYYGPGGMFELNGLPAPAKMPPGVNDPAVLKRLWEISAELIEVI